MARPLKMFMRGKRISMLQELLGRMGYPMNDQPGLFGASTRDAVKDVQTQRGLKPTGHADDELLQLMQLGQTSPPAKEKSSVQTTPSSTQNPVNQQQLDALIRLLIHKGLIDETELQIEMKRVQPKRVTQPPLT